jgi:predicted GNAT family N-acyltransferase
MTINYFFTDDKDIIRQAYALRKLVFVQEQQVPEELELDEFDATALHGVAQMDGKVVGVLRLLVEDKKGHLGRLAVSKALRGQGIGQQLVILTEAKAKELKLSEIYFHAQTHAMRFYEKLGYQTRGEVFDEAGIEHIEMYKELKN